VQVDFMGWTKRERRRARNFVFSEAKMTPQRVQSSKSAKSTAVALFEDDAAIMGDVDAPVSFEQNPAAQVYSRVGVELKLSR
jgi:hypothetical protein